MNRVIKFRVWDKEIGMKYAPMSMLDGEYVDINEQLRCLEINDRVLMQFTGLLDRHGNEIYEGDIISFQGTNGFIEWDNTQATYFAVKKSGDLDQIGTDWFGDYLDTIEIIGNIYESPESLSKLT